MLARSLHCYVCHIAKGFVMIGKFPRFTLVALIALSSPLALVHPTAAASAHQADGLSYILFSEGTNDTSMSGSMDDLEHARTLRNGREAMLFARVDGVSYVVRDSATLRRAHDIFEPQRQLGARQGALGARQGALGARQGALGAEQGRLGARMASASSRQSRDLSRQQSELGRRQNELGREQAALGARQAELGREQVRLGREAQARFRVLLADAIRSGIARRVN